MRNISEAMNIHKKEKTIVPPGVSDIYRILSPNNFYTKSGAGHIYSGIQTRRDHGQEFYNSAFYFLYFIHNSSELFPPTTNSSTPEKSLSIYIPFNSKKSAISNNLRSMPLEASCKKPTIEKTFDCIEPPTGNLRRGTDPGV